MDVRRSGAVECFTRQPASQLGTTAVTGNACAGSTEERKNKKETQLTALLPAACLSVFAFTGRTMNTNGLLR